MNKQLRNVLIAVGVSLVIVCCCVGLSIVYYSTPQGRTSATAQVVTALFEATSAQIDGSSATSTAQQDTPSTSVASTSPALSPANIPGLEPVDVTLNLEQRGFTCDEPSKPADYYVRYCDREDGVVASYHVEVWGRELFTVDLI